MAIFPYLNTNSMVLSENFGIIWYLFAQSEMNCIASRPISIPALHDVE